MSEITNGSKESSKSALFDEQQNETIEDDADNKGLQGQANKQMESVTDYFDESKDAVDQKNLDRVTHKI